MRGAGWALLTPTQRHTSCPELTIATRHCHCPQDDASRWQCPFTLLTPLHPMPRDHAHGRPTVGRGSEGDCGANPGPGQLWAKAGVARGPAPAARGQTFHRGSGWQGQPGPGTHPGCLRLPGEEMLLQAGHSGLREARSSQPLIWCRQSPRRQSPGCLPPTPRQNLAPLPISPHNRTKLFSTPPLQYPRKDPHGKSLILLPQSPPDPNQDSVFPTPSPPAEHPLHPLVNT